MHSGDHNIVEVLQVPCTALSVPALILKVQLLGQGPLQILGATQAVRGQGQKHCSLSTCRMPLLPVGSSYLEDPAEAEAGVHELHEPEQELQGLDVPIKAVPQVNVLHLHQARAWGGLGCCCLLSPLPHKVGHSYLYSHSSAIVQPGTVYLGQASSSNGLVVKLLEELMGWGLKVLKE